MNKNIYPNNYYIFDIIANRFEFCYDKINNNYFVIDTMFKTQLNLDVKRRKYSKYKHVSELEYIIFYYPKPNNVGKTFYKKSIYKIQFEIFGIFENHSGSPLSLKLSDCKKIIKNKNEELGYFTYTDMINSKDILLKKVYTFLRDNGGARKFREIIDEIGIDFEIYFTDYKGNFLKSKFEFIFCNILHFNNIDYEYEKIKIENKIPDFYLPKYNLLIEILGLSSRNYYSQKSKLKYNLYLSRGYKYEPIDVDRHRPEESIFKRCREIFGEIKTPNFLDYTKNYIITSKQFKNQLIYYLKELNDGKLLVSVRKDNIGFREKYRKYYEYVIEKYGNVQIGIKELVGIPSTKFKAKKIEKYWRNIDYVKDEIENVFRNELRIPTKYECLTDFKEKYNIKNLYRFWGEESLKEGGLFYDFIEELKNKYGFVHTVDKEEQKKFQKDIEIKSLVQLILIGKISLHGKNSFRNKYRNINYYLDKKYGGLFFYIKVNFGYPPSIILRPRNYYHVRENIEYELEENWKKYKRILSNSERIQKKNESTYYNMIHIIGISAFKRGGKYFDFIEKLKLKYGYDDRIEINYNKFHENILIYLNGINNGKWNTKTKSSVEIGDHQKYYRYINKTYGNVFLAVKALIGFPSPKVIRFHKYYDKIDNCKYEIENNIKRFGYLPRRFELKKYPFKYDNTLQGVYAKWKSKEFEFGGVFHKVVVDTLNEIERLKLLSNSL